jgi:protease-4
MAETTNSSADASPERQPESRDNERQAGSRNNERQAESQNIIVQVGGRRLSRTFCWIGWAGFAVCALFIFVQARGLHEYFDTTGGVQEKFHSGAEYAQNKVAIISIKGAILDGSGYVRKQIDRVRDDDKVKAVVVRVESPGGTVYGSDYIYHHLKRLREEKKIPLVVSMGSVAASGGYYVSMAVGDQKKSIYAEPMTTTGSIGVIIPHYDLSGLMARFDIKEDSLVSHPRKQLLSMTRPIPDDHRALLQAHLDEAFGRFKEIIKEGRPAFQMDGDALDQLATGEVFTALQAKKHGLVDEIGFIEDAIDRAIVLANLDKKKTRVVEFERTGSLLEIPLLLESDTRGIDLATWLDLNSPRVYYLATTLPPLMTHQFDQSDR